MPRTSTTKPIFATLCSLLFLIMQPAASTAGEKPTEYEVKSAFIYNLTKFTTWAEDSFKDGKQINICIVGRNSFGKSIDVIDGKKSSGKIVKVKRIKSGGKTSTFAGCHLVFIGKKEKRQMAATIKALKGRAILTISDIAGFSEAGGMVTLSKNRGHISIIINTTSLAYSGLTISSKVLRLARIVK